MELVTNYGLAKPQNVAHYTKIQKLEDIWKYKLFSYMLHNSESKNLY